MLINNRQCYFYGVTLQTHNSGSVIKRCICGSVFLIWSLNLKKAKQPVSTLRLQSHLCTTKKLKDLKVFNQTGPKTVMIYRTIHFRNYEKSLNWIVGL